MSSRPFTDTLIITVNPINDAPSFALAGNPPSSSSSDGQQLLPNFATSVSAGPADEAGHDLTGAPLLKIRSSTQKITPANHGKRLVWGAARRDLARFLAFPGAGCSCAVPSGAHHLLSNFFCGG